MIKIALCDSDFSTLSKHKNWIQYCAKKRKKLFHIQMFKTTSQLLSHFIRVSNLDILIIDPATLPYNSGLTTVKKLRELGCNAEIIYLASSEKHLLEAFDTEPLYYNNKKNMTLENFEKIFMKAVENRESMLASTRMFSVRSGSVIKRIPYDSISYFEISNRITTVNYGKNMSFDFYSTISELEKQLANNYFLRIHRSIIVNLLYVESYEQKSVRLLTSVTLPVGVTYSQLLVKSLSEL
jgi:DNA-binding LytR/AlgR family response regulator